MQRSTVGAAQMAQDLANWSTLNSPFYFSNGQMTMLATGEGASLHKSIAFATLAEQVQALLESKKKNLNDNPVAFGVIPFSEHDPVRFVVPDRLKVASNLRANHLPQVQRQGPVMGAQSMPTPAHYKQAVGPGLC